MIGLMMTVSKHSKHEEKDDVALPPDGDARGASLRVADMADEELIVKVSVGDRKAFNELASRHADFLYAMIYRMVYRPEDAEDIVQETFLRLWQKAGLWKPDGGASVKTWLYRIASNLCIDMKRKKANQEGELKVEPPSEAASAEREMQSKQTGEAVAAALAELPDRQRIALILCHYQGMSNAEAADVLKTTVKGVEGLLVRARQAVKQKLQKQYEILI